MKQSELLRQILIACWKSKIRPDMKPSDWLKAILYFHEKGWLYAIAEKDELQVAVVAYRVEEVKSDTAWKVPAEEKGEILYIPFIISKHPDKWKLTRMAKKFLKDNPDVKEIVFQRDKDDKLIRIKGGKKELKDGRKEETRITEPA